MDPMQPLPAHFDLSETWRQRFMRLAIEVGSWSKDPASKVGAVLVDRRKRVTGLGFNGFPRNVPDHPELLEDRDAKLMRTVHAEVNAILNATADVDGCALFATLHPCLDCAKFIVQCGIGKVYHLEALPGRHSRWMENFESARTVFREGGVLLEEVPRALVDVPRGPVQP